MDPVSLRTNRSRETRRASQGQNIDRASHRRSSSLGATGSDGTAEGNLHHGDGCENRTTGSSAANPNASATWRQAEVPGGRKLWRRLVIGFAVVASFGAVFITLGAVYLDEANRWADEDSLTMPLVLCIISMVTGVLFILGSIILGKLIISDKWRKNQQPTYRNMAMRAAVTYSRTRDESSGTYLDGTVDLQMEPPTYEASLADPTTAPQNVFIISGQNINVNMSSATDQRPSPPEYTEQTEAPPPAYSENGYSPDGSAVPEGQPPKYTSTSDGSTEDPARFQTHSPGVTAENNSATPSDTRGLPSQCQAVSTVTGPTLNVDDIHRVLGGRSLTDGATQQMTSTCHSPTNPSVNSAL